MRLNPGASVTDTPAAGDINRTNAAGASGAKTAGAPQDAIRVSRGFESLAILSAHQASNIVKVAAAVRSGKYGVDSVAVGRAIIAEALR